jgi:hypothetical protein
LYVIVPLLLIGCGSLSLEKLPPSFIVVNPDNPSKTTIHTIKNPIRIFTLSHVAKHLAQNKDGSILYNFLAKKKICNTVFLQMESP